MGASDARIIFRHLYPNTLSHVIVILTLTIPGVILAESFLSFLGIGITGAADQLGLDDAQRAESSDTGPEGLDSDADRCSSSSAVLGFNFLGDGLRDAADPYASR